MKAVFFIIGFLVGCIAVLVTAILKASSQAEDITNKSRAD